MVFPADLRRQASVCARLAEDSDDLHLAERLKLMAADLAGKAAELEGFDILPGERLPGKSGCRLAA
jgi:hypothetical protein